jgi:hypothetical protein
MNGDRVTTDEIARLAVRALAAGRAHSVDDAIDRALSDAHAPRGAQRPTRALLRAHAQALEEAGAGELSRLLRIEATMQEALSVLSTLEQVLIEHDRDFADHRAPAVFGRAARGEFDLDPTVHARVVSDTPSHILAQALADAGFGETSVGTIDTRYGHLDEIAFETEHARYHIARIPPRARIDHATDLVRGKPVESADFEQLLRRMPRFGITDPDLRKADSPFPPPR